MRTRLEAAREAILSAGSFIRETFGRGPGGITEKARNDFVTETDHQSEKIICDMLGRVYPDIPVLAEEGSGTAMGDTFWIVDPLDGTTNFIHGYPQVGVSIALAERGEIVLGLVYDPLREEMFEAIRGDGAFCNGRRIHVSNAETLSGSLIGTGFPFRIHGHLDRYLVLFRDIFLGCRGIRRAGAAVLDLSHVAAGRLDGFFELYLKPWDMAAGGLIVTEAGGRVSDFFGGSDYLSTGNIVAGTAAVHAGILDAARVRFEPYMLAELSNDLMDPPG